MDVALPLPDDQHEKHMSSKSGVVRSTVARGKRMQASDGPPAHDAHYSDRPVQLTPTNHLLQLREQRESWVQSPFCQ